MNSQEINHAHGLITALGRKAMLLRQQAEYLDSPMDERDWCMAVAMRQQADDLLLRAEELKAAADAHPWLDR